MDASVSYPTVRRITFYDSRWQRFSQKATRNGQFVVTVQRKGETTSVIRGRLILHIRKNRLGVLITGLYRTLQSKP